MSLSPARTSLHARPHLSGRMVHPFVFEQHNQKIIDPATQNCLCLDLMSNTNSLFKNHSVSQNTFFYFPEQHKLPIKLFLEQHIFELLSSTKYPNNTY
jgi:hypothetical protein